MAKFKFYLDKKQTIWQREYHEIEAENRDDVVKKIKQAMLQNFTPDEISDELESFKEQEMLFDTIDDMTVEENQGKSTIEIYFDEEDAECIAKNGI